MKRLFLWKTIRVEYVVANTAKETADFLGEVQYPLTGGATVREVRCIKDLHTRADVDIAPMMLGTVQQSPETVRWYLHPDNLEAEPLGDVWLVAKDREMTVDVRRYIHPTTVPPTDIEGQIQDVALMYARDLMPIGYAIRGKRMDVFCKRLEPPTRTGRVFRVEVCMPLTRSVNYQLEATVHFERPKRQPKKEKKDATP